ncbi:MAG: hypothetical protein LBV38_04510 [Alistipes sp.]|nr:hypothetical protein [Alistipes sp.]
MAATVAATTIGLTACGDDDNGGGVTPPPPPPAPEIALWEGTDIKGTIDTEMTGETGKITLDATKTYDLSGNLFVEDGATLIIPAGTRIEASAGFESYILVLQGGKIEIAGTAAAPVTMTAKGATAAGAWGGLVINGKAPLAGGGTASTEINSDYEYGGTDEADNSGSITYLTLEYTGAKNSANIEHNGLTLNGVGNGTKIENVFVPNSADDGIEFFGGSVNVTNLLVINSDDDMFDFTQGYTGTLTNAYGLWESGMSSGESDPSGVEADGNFDGNFPAHTGQSDFTIAGVTFDLRMDYNATESAYRLQNVLRIRRGATATITNALVRGIGRAENLINLSDGKGDANTATAIALTDELTTPADVTFLPAGKEADYTEVSVATGNTGATTAPFAWTGYTF